MHVLVKNYTFDEQLKYYGVIPITWKWSFQSSWWCLTISNNNEFEEGNGITSNCRNCSHQISLHDPICSASDDDHKCECDNPEFYNSIISGKYIGWMEIHCNSCGKLVCYIDSSNENIYDFNILCNKCISQKH